MNNDLVVWIPHHVVVFIGDYSKGPIQTGMLFKVVMAFPCIVTCGAGKDVTVNAFGSWKIFDGWIGREENDGFRRFE